jgi:AcrR family transcriptional regulator
MWYVPNRHEGGGHVARTVGSVADETRQRIIDAATMLFIERGYTGTSVRDIAERLGMTKGSLYYHFESKEDLLHAAVSPLLDGVAKFLCVVHDAGPMGAERVRELVDLLDAHAPMVRSLSTDPAVTRTKLEDRGALATSTNSNAP